MLRQVKLLMVKLFYIVIKTIEYEQQTFKKNK